MAKKLQKDISEAPARKRESLQDALKRIAAEAQAEKERHDRNPVHYDIVRDEINRIDATPNTAGFEFRKLGRNLGGQLNLTPGRTAADYSDDWNRLQRQIDNNPQIQGEELQDMIQQRDEAGRNSTYQRWLENLNNRDRILGTGAPTINQMAQKVNPLSNYDKLNEDEKATLAGYQNHYDKDAAERAMNTLDEYQQQGISFNEYYRQKVAENAVGGLFNRMSNNNANEDLQRLKEARARHRATELSDGTIVLEEEIDANIERLEAQLRENRDRYRPTQYDLRYAEALRFADVGSQPDFQQGVEAGREKFAGLQQEIDAGREQRAAAFDLANPEAAGQNDGSDFYTYRTPASTWDQEQTDKFMYLYNRDPQQAYDYAISVNRSIRSQLRAEHLQELSDWGSDHPGMALAGKVATMPTALWDYMGYWGEYGNTGVLMPVVELSPSDWGDVWVSGGAQGLNERYGVIQTGPFAGKGWGDVYQLAESIIESQTAAQIGKASGIGLFTSLLFFGTAAKQGTLEAMERGADPGKALMYGAGCGAAECLGESLSIEKLMNTDFGPGFRGWVTGTLKQGFTEGSEEVFTNFLQRGFDKIILGDESEMSREIQTYMDRGMDRDMAIREAWINAAKDDAFAFLGGAISGAVGANLAQSVNDLQARQVQARTETENQVLAAVQRATRSDEQAASVLQDIANDPNLAQAFQSLYGETVQDFLNREGDLEQSTRGALGNKLRSAFAADDADISQDKIDSYVSGYQLGGNSSMDSYVDAMRNLDRANGPIETRFKTVQTKDGQTANVKNASMEDGKLTLSIDRNGTTESVGLADLNLSKEQKDAFRDLMRVAGEDAAAIFNGMSERQKTGGIMEYATAFANIRDLFGARGATEQAALNSSIRGNLTDAQVIQAYEIGKKRGVKTTERKKSRRGSGNVSLNGGTVNGRTLQAVSDPESVLNDDNYKAVKAVAEALGIDVVIFESRADDKGNLTDVNGAYQDGVIYLDWNAGMNNVKDIQERMLLRTMGHELTHFIQQNAPKEYQELKEFITDYLSDTMGRSFNRLVADKLRRDPSLSKAGAEDEVVADACETMLRDSQAVQELMQEHQSLWQKIRSWIHNFLACIRPDDRGAIALQPVIREVQEIWDRGLKAAVESRPDAENEKTAPEGGSAQWAMRMMNNESDADKATRLSEATVQYVTASKESLEVAKGIDVSNVKAQHVSKILAPIWEKFGIIGDHYNRLLDVSFNYSRTAADRSFSHQISVTGKDYSAQAIVQANLKELCKSAYPVEAHADEKPASSQAQLKQVITLFNAIQAGDDAIFVKMTVKIPAEEDNRLHMVVTSDIKRGLDLALIAEAALPQSAGKSNPIISIRQFLEFVKDDEEFTKRIPVGEVLGQSRDTAKLSARSTAGSDRQLLENVNLQTVMSERLQQENEILQSSVDELQKLLGKKDKTIIALRRQLRTTKSPELRMTDARRMARSILKDYESLADAEQIAEEIKDLGEFILGTELSGDEYNHVLEEKIGSIAQEIVESANSLVSDGTEEYRDIAERVKGAKISIDESEIGEIGDYDAFRKSMFGKITVSKRRANSREGREGYLSVDTFYTELQGDYGKAFFPDALNEGEQLLNIARVFDLARPYEVNPYERHMEEAEESVGKRILLDFYSDALRLEPPTSADRQKSRAEALRAQIRALDQRNKMSETEAEGLYQTIYDLSLKLDKAGSDLKSHRATLAKTAEQLQQYQKQAERYHEAEAKVTETLGELDKLVKDGADPKLIQKQRAKVTAAEGRMSDALQKLTQIQDSAEIQDILRAEREIQRTRTRERDRETAGRRELRAKIDKLWKDLNRRITNPSEKKNIPVPVMEQAVEVLQTINMDTSRDGSVSGQKLRNKLLELRARYEALQNDPDYRQAAVYDEQISAYLSNMIDEVGDTPINKMTAQQLATVYNTLQALDYTARHALKLKLGEEERNAYDVSRAMTQETRDVGKQHTGLGAMWINAQLTPERMFNRLGGYAKDNTWLKVYRMLDDGQLKQTQLQMEGSIIFEDLLESKDYAAFINPKKTVDIGLVDEDGNAVPITHGMMVSLYMHLQNEQNRQHVAYGGLTIPGLKEYYNGKKVKGAENATRIGGALQELADINDQLHSEEDVDAIAELEARRDEIAVKAMSYVEELQQAIEKELTDYDREWIAACKELFDGFSKRELNETTMDVYGIKRANVENYMPIWVDGDFLNTPFETVAKDMSLENAGFMKERVDSSKPIRLADISDVAASQIRKVAQYCGLMPAVRNFNKVWGKTQTGYRDSLRKAVHEVFGQNGVQYIENLMADLNGARGNNESAFGEMLNRIRGHMAQAALTMSLRVALGQTASYPTAAAVVGWKALHKALWRGGKSGRMISRADKALIQKWSPLLYYRMKGYRDTELGDISGMNDKWSRLWKKARWATGWIQAMDGATVGRLWYAAEYYVQDNFKDLDKGTDAYYEQVAKVFNDVVEKTQPNYTVMQRPDILRNPNALVKQLTMFMTQRLQNMNIVYDACATYSKMRSDFRSGKNGVTTEDVKKAAIASRTAVISQIAAAATISAFKFLADGILHSMNAYRDDDDELTKESISLELLDMFLDSLTGNVLGGGEVYDLIESKAFQKTYYGLEVSSVAVIKDLAETASKIFDHAVNGSLSLKDLDNLAKRLGSLVGIPYANGKKVVDAIRFWAEDYVKGELLSFEAGVDRTTAQQAHRLYRAYRDMDFGKVNQIRGEFDTQDGLDEAVRTYIKDQYKNGQINVYEAERQLMDYGNANPTVMANFIKEQYLAGNLPEKDAIAHLVTYGGRTQESAEKTIRNLKAEMETGTGYDDLKDAFMAGSLSDQEALDMLINYGNVDPAEAQDRVDYWAYQNQGGTLSQTRYSTFRSDVEPLGVSLDYYEQALVEIDINGNGSFSQAEAGPYLCDEEAAGRLTHEQAAAIWSAITTGKTDYDGWLAKNK